jgi:PAS domain S-box-containing protein
VTEAKGIMHDEEKTKMQLIDELHSLRLRMADLEKEAEVNLKNGTHRERFAEAFFKNAIPLGITTFKEGRFVEVSDSFLSMVGATREEIIGNTSVGMGILTTEQRKAVSDELQKKGLVENLELEIRTNRGEKIRGLFNATGISLDGEDYLLTVMIDITRYKLAEAALRESEERYRTIIESIGDGYNEVDPKGNFTFFNESFRKLLGYDREEILGMNYRRFTDSESAEKIFRAYNKVWETGVPLDRFEWDIIRKDGVRRSIEISVCQIKDPSGKAVGFGGIARDATDRKQAEWTLKESEANYRAIFENAIMGIYQSTPEGRYINTNQAFADIFGYDSPEDILNQINDIGKQMYANPEDRSRIRALLDVHERATIETAIRRKDGTIGWILNNVRLIRDDEGKVHCYEGFVQDVTGLKQVEEELRVARERMELALRGANLGMYDGNLETGEFYVDDRYLDMLGFTREEFPRFTAETWEMLVHPDDREFCMQGYRQVMEGLLQSGRREYRLRHKSGRWVWVLDQGKVVNKDDQGRPLRICGTHLDITDRRLLEEELQKSLLELESRVQERTADLKDANTALRVLVNRRAEDQSQLQKRLQLNVNDLVLPVIDELKACSPDKKVMGYLTLLESNLKDVTAPFLNGLQTAYRNLTSREIQVAAMIREGKKTKEISELIGVSPVTVETHRNHIRTKLGLVKGKTNLRSYLLSIK